MRNLLVKELRLSIHPFFFVIPFLTGALFLIPQWLFFLALMYFFFVSVPNIHSTYNSQNDNGFTAMMPVSKKDIVRSRIAAIVILELLHLAVGVLYAALNRILYGQENFFMDPNAAFFGAAFVMFGIFNLVFFPMYFRTAWNFGMPTIFGSAAALVFATAMEFSVILIPSVNRLMEGTDPPARTAQFLTLAAGVVLFLLATRLACGLSVRRFEAADL